MVQDHVVAGGVPRPEADHEDDHQRDEEEQGQPGHAGQDQGGGADLLPDADGEGAADERRRRVPPGRFDRGGLRGHALAPPLVRLVTP